MGSGQTSDSFIFLRIIQLVGSWYPFTHSWNKLTHIAINSRYKERKSHEPWNVYHQYSKCQLPFHVHWPNSLIYQLSKFCPLQKAKKSIYTTRNEYDAHIKCTIYIYWMSQYLSTYTNQPILQWKPNSL